MKGRWLSSSISTPKCFNLWFSLSHLERCIKGVLSSPFLTSKNWRLLSKGSMTPSLVSWRAIASRLEAIAIKLEAMTPSYNFLPTVLQLLSQHHIKSHLAGFECLSVQHPENPRRSSRKLCLSQWRNKFNEAHTIQQHLWVLLMSIQIATWSQVDPRDTQGLDGMASYNPLIRYQFGRSQLLTQECSSTGFWCVWCSLYSRSPWSHDWSFESNTAVNSHWKPAHGRLSFCWKHVSTNSQRNPQTTRNIVMTHCA